MTTITFDTHAYVKKLRNVGISEEQAEVQAEILAGLVNEQLFTKQHLDIRLKELETSLKIKMANIKADILKWITGMLVAQAAIVATLVKLL